MVLAALRDPLVSFGPAAASAAGPCRRRCPALARLLPDQRCLIRCLTSTIIRAHQGTY